MTMTTWPGFDFLEPHDVLCFWFFYCVLATLMKPWYKSVTFLILNTSLFSDVSRQHLPPSSSVHNSLFSDIRRSWEEKYGALVALTKLKCFLPRAPSSSIWIIFLAGFSCFWQSVLEIFCITLPSSHAALCSDLFNPDLFRLVKFCFLCPQRPSPRLCNEKHEIYANAVRKVYHLKKYTSVWNNQVCAASDFLCYWGWNTGGK